MISIKKSQSWSIDIILAVLIFMGAFVIVYLLIGADPNTKVRTLKEEASAIIKQISSGDLGFVKNEEVNESKLNELKNLSYGELKRRLRTEGDFCIYIEDEKGNVVLINNSYKGIGASNINISGTPCSQK